jgi:NAD(P)H-flavin reductase
MASSALPSNPCSRGCDAEIYLAGPPPMARAASDQVRSSGIWIDGVHMGSLG